VGCCCGVVSIKLILTFLLVAALNTVKGVDYSNKLDICMKTENKHNVWMRIYVVTWLHYAHGTTKIKNGNTHSSSVVVNRLTISDIYKNRMGRY